MQTLIADTLKAWREAERVLQGLPPTDPAHDQVRRLVIDLRAMYAQLSESVDISEATAQRGRALIASATELFKNVRGEPA